MNFTKTVISKRIYTLLATFLTLLIIAEQAGTLDIFEDALTRF